MPATKLMTPPALQSGLPFHIMTKPIGPVCNLDCTYCFYLEKEDLYGGGETWRMSDDLLERYIRQYIQSQKTAEINFAWQGGEPTLLGVDFFRRVVELQREYADGRKINNAMQTNGTLLDDDWCELFTRHDFLIGLSIDGPRELHDRYRLDKKGQPSFDAVIRGLGFLKNHNTQFNTLTVVHRSNSQRPLEVYRFLKDIGSQHIQFIPLVERSAEVPLKVNGRSLASPPLPGKAGNLPVTSWSVEPLPYGQFLARIFDEWVRNDVGRIFVQSFDVALGCWMGRGSSLCVFAERCGRALAMEHNGDLYACDHYVYPEYRLGNIQTSDLSQMVDSPQQLKFGNDKLDTLPKYCRDCDVRFACNGDCPKHRFMAPPAGEGGLSYLCPGYKHLFHHIDPYMRTMAQLLGAGQPPARIMEILKQRPQPDKGKPGRNDPCPCGSGKKYKKCCASKVE